MKMNAKMLESNKRIVSLTLESRSEDDTIFMTKLYKAMLFRDDIAINNGDDTWTRYIPGENNDATEEEI